MAWAEQTFKVAWGVTGQGAVDVRGWVREGRGVGLYFNKAGDWWVVHLNSGHGITKLSSGAEPHEIFACATEIAECTDWSFSTVKGWENTDPAIPRKLGDIWARHPWAYPHKPAGATPADETAREIAESREFAVLEEIADHVNRQ